MWAEKEDPFLNPLKFRVLLKSTYTARLSSQGLWPSTVWIQPDKDVCCNIRDITFAISLLHNTKLRNSLNSHHVIPPGAHTSKPLRLLRPSEKHPKNNHLRSFSACCGGMWRGFWKFITAIALYSNLQSNQGTRWWEMWVQVKQNCREKPPAAIIHKM